MELLAAYSRELHVSAEHLPMASAQVADSVMQMAACTDKQALVIQETLLTVEKSATDIPICSESCSTCGWGFHKGYNGSS